MAKPKDPVVEERVFKNVYVCRKCNSKIRSGKIEKTKCRKCGSKSLRLKKKDMKSAG